MSTAHHVIANIIPKHVVLPLHVTVHKSNVYDLAHLSSVLYLLLLHIYHFSYRSFSSSASADTIDSYNVHLVYIRCHLVLHLALSANVVKHINQDFDFHHWNCPKRNLPEVQKISSSPKLPNASSASSSSHMQGAVVARLVGKSALWIGGPRERKRSCKTWHRKPGNMSSTS